METKGRKAGRSPQELLSGCITHVRLSVCMRVQKSISASAGCSLSDSPSSCAEVTLVSLCFAFHVSLVFFLWAEMCPRLSNMLTATLWSGGAWLTFKRTFPRRQQRAFL